MTCLAMLTLYEKWGRGAGHQLEAKQNQPCSNGNVRAKIQCKLSIVVSIINKCPIAHELQRSIEKSLYL